MAAVAAHADDPFKKRVGAACCALGPSVVAMGGLTDGDANGRSTLTNDVSTWSADYGWRHHRLAFDAPAPKPRAGHTCCARDDGVLVFGGYDASAAKLADLWELRTTGTATAYELELGVLAVLSVEDQEADIAARQKAAGKQKGTLEELEPLPLFEPARFRAALEAALQLPTEAVDVSEPSAQPDRPSRVSVKVTIRPLLAVGMRVYGVDGDGLPCAALTVLRDQLAAAGVPEGMVEVASDPKDKTKAKAAAPAKGGVKAAVEAEPPVGNDRPAAPDVGYALKCWALHETHKPVSDVLSWQPCTPMGDASKPIVARSGHSASVWGGMMWVFGGSASTGALATLSTLELASLEWVTLETTGRAPAARFSHSACVLDAADGAAPLLVICGGLDGRKRLGDCCLLDLAKKTWCAVEMGAAVASSFPLSAAWHTLSACGRRALAFGGIDAHVDALRATALLDFELDAEPAATPPAGPAGGAAAASGKYRMRITAASSGDERCGPPPRFSHCAAAAPVPASLGHADSAVAVLIFGGTTAAHMLDDCWLITVRG